jgi:hypothetical protein
VLAANNLGFGLALADSICQEFGQPQCDSDMACPKYATQSLFGSIEGKEMVQQCHAWCAGCKQAWFLLGSG